MGQKQIMQLFFENPGKEFHIRGIARQLRISKTAASYHINRLVREGLVQKSRKGVFPSYAAGETGLFRHYKRQWGIEQIVRSGLIEALEQLNPSCIVLFGSFAKGEYDTRSDIDLFVQAHDAPFGLTPFEKKLKHKIHILFSEELSTLSPQLYGALINGMTLSGYLKAR